MVGGVGKKVYDRFGTDLAMIETRKKKNLRQRSIEDLRMYMNGLFRV